MFNPTILPVTPGDLFALARLGNKDCAACVRSSTKQIERARDGGYASPGARDLLGETRVPEAHHPNKGASDVPTKGGAPARSGARAQSPRPKAKEGKARQGHGKEKHK